ncbi:hypothetical protein GF312_03725 [Candidatus Poribacteria bacterium]|nr:hypothetical protein [Candidatus Poribacteria bacterium]
MSRLFFRQFMRKLEEFTTLLASAVVNNLIFSRKILIKEHISKIAVIKLDHMGDVILSIPALACLRESFPEAHITMVVSPSTKQIAEYIPYIDEVICYNARFFNRSGNTKRFGLSKAIDFIFDMKEKDFDLLIDLRGSFASIGLALASASCYRLDRAEYIINRKLSKNKLWPEHEAEVNLDLLAGKGLNVNHREIYLDIPEKDIKSTDKILGLNEDTYKTIITIHPGSPIIFKRWSIDNYIKLSHRLYEKYRSRLVFIGVKEEEKIVEGIVSHLERCDTINLCGKTSLSQLIAVLSKSDIFIGNDSGPMHLASACGTKTIGLFGPSSPKRFGPYGDNSYSLRMEKKCPPCMGVKCKYPGYRCIDNISVEDVMRKIDDIIPDKNRN